MMRRNLKTNLKKTAAVLGAAAMVMGLAGCGSAKTADTAGTAEPDKAAQESGTAAQDAGTTAADTTEVDSSQPGNAQLSGSITLAGSTSMEKFSNALAEAFMEKYPDVTVQAEFTGSSAGVEAVLAGQSDIGNSSRNLKEEEKAKGAVENIVAIDGIAVVTGPAGTVEDLTKKTEDDMLKVRNLGRKSLDEVIQKIHSYGLCLLNKDE